MPKCPSLSRWYSTTAVCLSTDDSTITWHCLGLLGSTKLLYLCVWVRVRARALVSVVVSAAGAHLGRPAVRLIKSAQDKSMLCSLAAMFGINVLNLYIHLQPPHIELKHTILIKFQADLSVCYVTLGGG